VVKPKPFFIEENAFKFYMERWAQWATSRYLGVNVGFPHTSAFTNTRVDNGGRAGSSILAADNPDMEYIEGMVSALSMQDPVAAEAVRARWEARVIYFDKAIRTKAAIASAILSEKGLTKRPLSLTTFKSHLGIGNAALRYSMGRDRFSPRFSREDVDG